MSVIKAGREIIVTGMHRSGTSAVANLVHRLGINIGNADQLVAGSRENEKGFFENEQAVAINNEILQRLHSNWHDINVTALSDIDSQWCDQETADKMSTFLMQYRQDRGSFLVKDPRFCLTLKAWSTALSNPLILVCLRSPLEIARSLQKRNGFSLFKGLGLWEFYLKSLGASTSGLDVVFINFNKLVASPDEESQVLVKTLQQYGVTDIDYDQAAVSVAIDRRLRHERNDNTNLRSLLSAEQFDLWNRLQQGELATKKIGREIGEYFCQKDTAIGYNDPLREIQLFYSRDGQFCEENSVKTIRTGLEHSHIFTLPEDFQNISKLRLDPAGAPCVIDRLKIELYAGEKRLPVEELAHNAQVDNKNGIFYFTSSDPYCIFLSQITGISKVKVDLRFINRTGAEADALFAAFFMEKEIEKTAVLADMKNNIASLRLENKKIAERKAQIKAALDGATLEKESAIEFGKNAEQRATTILDLLRKKENKRGFIRRASAIVAHSVYRFRSGGSLADYRIFLQYCKACDDEGAFFSTEYYTSVYPDVLLSSLTPADHYFFLGWKERRNPGPFFDTGFYLENHPELIQQGENPLCHYISKGWKEGADPAPAFSTPAYLAENSAVFQEQCPPAHFFPDRLKQSSETVALPTFVNRQYSCTRPVEIIIPTYLRGEEAAAIFRRLLLSLAASYPQADALLRFHFIDDHSPYIAAEQLIEECGLHRRDDILFSRNEKNLGFVDTVNLGFTRSRPDADVVLLNCDTEIHGDVFSRLQDLCYRYPKVASVTPLSNRSTITSLSYWPHGADVIFDLDPEEIASTIHDASLESPLSPLPTGHGFCMYLSRAAIDAVGVLDSERFKQGYGEENDWSVRAIQKGFCHLISTECYVHHHETRSFTADQKKKLSEQNSSLLVDKHPCYPYMVMSYLQRDPLCRYRFFLKLLLLETAAKKNELRTICFFLHDSFRFQFGGVQRHINDICQGLLQREDTAIIVISPMRYGAREYEFTLFQRDDLLFFDEISEEELLVLLPFVERRTDALHVHHFLGMQKELLSWLKQSSIARKYFTIHDLALFGKRPNLLDDNGIYGVASHADRKGALLPPEQIDANLRVLTDFTCVFTPSTNTRDVVLSLCPEKIVLPEIEVMPHFLPFIDKITEFIPEQQEAVNNVAFIGALCHHKGGDIFLSALPGLRQSGFSPMVFGIADPATMKRFPDEYIPMHSYRNWCELDALHSRFGLCCAILPAICGETFSYTLYESLFVLRVPVVVGPYGHPADIVRAHGVGEVLTETTPEAICTAVEKIAADRNNYVEAVNQFITSHRADFSEAAYISSYYKKFFGESGNEMDTPPSPSFTLSPAAGYRERIIESRIWLKSRKPSFSMLLARPLKQTLSEKARCSTLAKMLRASGCEVVEIETTPETLGSDLLQTDILYLHGAFPEKQIAPFAALARESGIPVVWDSLSSSLPFTPSFPVDVVLTDRAVSNVGDNNRPLHLVLPIYADETHLPFFEKLYDSIEHQKENTLGLVQPTGNDRDGIFSQLLEYIAAERAVWGDLQLTIFSDEHVKENSEPWINYFTDSDPKKFFAAISNCVALLLPAVPDVFPRQLHHLILCSSLIGTPVITNCQLSPHLPAENGITGWFLPQQSSLSSWSKAIRQSLADGRSRFTGTSAHLAAFEHGRAKEEEILNLFAAVIEARQKKSLYGSS